MKTLSGFVLLWVVLSTGFPVFGQLSLSTEEDDPPIRIEIPVKSINETYRVIPLGRKGMIICYRSVEMVLKEEVNWYFSLYDSNLLQQWTVPVPVPAEHMVARTLIWGDSAVLLLSAAGKSRTGDNRIELIFLTPGKESVRITREQTDPGAEYVNLALNENKLIFSAEFPSSPSKIYTFDPVSGSLKAFKTAPEGEISIVALLPKLSLNRIFAVVRKKVSRKESISFFMTYDSAGNVIEERPVPTPTDTELTHGQIIDQGENRFLLLGCYGQIGHGTSKEEERKSLSTGLISVPIIDSKPQNFKLFNFIDLASSNQFLAEKDIISLKKKALKKNKSINDYSVDFHILMHDVRTSDSAYLIVLEIFNPQYHSETFTDFDFYGRPYTNSYSVFDGYKFSNAIIAGFSQSGELRWDNSISFRNILTMDLVPRLVVFPHRNNENVIFYLSENMIGSKIINEARVVEKATFTPLELRYADDKIISESRAVVRHWYGDYFLAYGYYEIKNLSGKAGNKRLVYTVTKTKFVP